MDTRSILLFASILLGVGVLHFVYRLYVERRRFNDLPKPPHSFLWGHMQIMIEATAAHPPGTHMQILFTWIAQKYDLKGLWYLDLWPLSGPQLVLDEPELMEAVQVTRVYDQHHVVNEAAEEFVGYNSLAAINGPIWKQIHKAMSPAFLPSYLRTQYDALVLETMIFRDKITRFAKNGQVFSLEKEAAAYVFDVVGRLTFSTSIGAQSTMGSTMFNDLREIIHFAAGFNPLNPVTRYLNSFKLARVQKHMDATIAEKIHQRLMEHKAANTEPTRKNFGDILDALLSERYTEVALSDKKAKPVDLHPDDLRTVIANIKGAFAGANGTTGSALSFTYMLLSKNPDVVAKLREEHNRVFDKDLSKTIEILQASPPKLHEMEYTTAVIKETLRLFSIGLLYKQAPPGATLRWQNRDYPADGFMVIPNQHSLQFNPAYYPSPSQFKPERFIGDAVPRAWFRTFGRGPRQCIGQNLAMDAIRINLLLMLRDFDFEIYDLKPNAKPKSIYTDLDTIYGDIIFQEEDVEAKPRGGMMMTAQKLDKIYT